MSASGFSSVDDRSPLGVIVNTFGAAAYGAVGYAQSERSVNREISGAAEYVTLLVQRYGVSACQRLKRGQGIDLSREARQGGPPLLGDPVHALAQSLTRDNQMLSALLDEAMHATVEPFARDVQLIRATNCESA
jgi:hypothetical protein